MNPKPQTSINRREFLGTSAAAVVAASDSAAAASPLERAAKFRLRPKIVQRIEAGQRAILDELKPTRQQIEHGLELHYNSFVADVQGNVPVVTAAGISGDRMQAELVRIRQQLQAQKLEPKELNRRLSDEHRRRRVFETAFDPQWIEESRALYAITGVQLGLEDMAHPGENTFEAALDHIVRANFVYEQRGDLIRVSNAQDIARGRREGKTCTVLPLAGDGGFAEADEPLRNLDWFYALGIRMSQFTYIQKNKLCCSWLQGDDTGLTAMGKQVVRRMNDLGIMADIAHCGLRSSLDIVAASAEPVLVSHTGCKAVYDDATNPEYLKAVFAQAYAQGIEPPKKTGSRNADDEILRAVAKRDGLVAIYTLHYVLGTGPESFSTWFRHLEHAIKVAGMDHVGIGTDRTFFPSWKPGPLDWINWPYLTVGLVCRGFTDADIRKIIGGNYLRFTERVLSKQPWGPLM